MYVCVKVRMHKKEAQGSAVIGQRVNEPATSVFSIIHTFQIIYVRKKLILKYQKLYKPIFLIHKTKCVLYPKTWAYIRLHHFVVQTTKRQIYAAGKSKQKTLGQQHARLSNYCGKGSR